MADIDKNLLTGIADQTRHRYAARFQEHGLSPRSLGWGTREQQTTRFDQVRRIIDFDGSHVLDIGCGFGDLYQYLKHNNVDVTYTGVDVCQEFIDVATDRHPDGQFLCTDLTTDELCDVGGDVVVMLGLLNYRQSETANLTYAETLIDRAFDKARRSLVCDFISDQRALDYPEEEWIYYYSPEEVVKLASAVTPSWQLLQDFPCIPQREMMLRLDKV